MTDNLSKRRIHYAENTSNVQIKEKSRWPYGFMDFDKLGVPTVALTIVILIVVFVALGYLYVVIDKKLGEKIKKAEN